MSLNKFILFKCTVYSSVSQVEIKEPVIKKKKNSFY